MGEKSTPDSPAQSGNLDSEKFKRELGRGISEYNKGAYEAAAVAFWNAYYLRPDSKILFNIAQAYRKSGQREQAISLFQRYQKEQPNTPLALEAAVLENTLRSELEASRQAESQRHSESLTQKNQALYEKLGIVLAENQRLLAIQEQQRPPVYKNPWLWGGLAIGVVALSAVGVGLALGLPRPRPDASLGSRSVPAF